MILAAGLGKRMLPLTVDKPKPLIHVQGKPMIDHAIDRLVAVGVETIIVNIHYKADMLRAHLAGRGDVEIIISDETGQLLDSGGGIVRVLKEFKGDIFITHNADSLWTESGEDALASLVSTWDGSKMDCLMMLAAMSDTVGVDWDGDFSMARDGRLTFRAEDQVAPYVWTGVQILHPRFFEGAPDGPFSIHPFWRKAQDIGRFFGRPFEGTWLHVGTPAGLGEAEAFLKGV